MVAAAPKPQIEQILRRAKKLKQVKSPWLDLWQLVGEFIHTRKQDFTTTHEAGAFLNRELFDSTGPKSAKIAASSLLSMLWPSSGKRFRVRPPDSLRETGETKKYYEFVTRKMTSVMDDPQTGLRTSLDEYMLDQMTFATSGVEIARDKNTKVMYRPWGVSRMSVAEGRNGFVDTVYIEEDFKISQLIQEYGEEKLSERSRGLAKSGKLDENVKVLIAIEPRLDRDRTKKGSRAMPWQSFHIEMNSKHVLREAGFEEMPIPTTRFTKLIREPYGRGFGMDALPDILEINAIWEAVTVAIEKLLDPPLGVLDDGRLGAGEIDTSAGAINTFNISGRAGEKNPVFPLFTVGEIKQVTALLEKLEQSISNHFSIDRLLDFNNETQMTLGEAQLRNRLRNATLASIFSRQIAELFTPLIQRTFNILLDEEELGIFKDSSSALTVDNPVFIPAEVQKLMITGQDVYRIEYLTPAQRIMQIEEAEGILKTWDLAERMFAVDPTVLDNVEVDETWRIFRELVGGPSEMQRSKADRENIRIARAEKQDEQEKQELALKATEGARNIGQSGLFPQSVPAAAA